MKRKEDKRMNYGIRTYFEVLWWRWPFDPEGDLESDHGDLRRETYDSLEEASSYARATKEPKVYVRLHRVERCEIAESSWTKQ